MLWSETLQTTDVYDLNQIDSWQQRKIKKTNALQDTEIAKDEFQTASIIE